MDIYDSVIELAKRRGFLWNSFEIYGGTAGFYDYGPLGAMLKRRIENIWRDIYVINEGYYEIEVPTIGIEDVFVASGHVGGFSDPLTECVKCHESFRADHLVEDFARNPDTLTPDELSVIIKENNIRCPDCGGELGGVYEFNLMFSTSIGPGSKRVGYLRPETAQGMFVDFPRLLRFYREKLPFGVTQIGKAYRNEISPRQGVIRLREFTQAEAEIFVDPRDKSHPGFDSIRDNVLILYSDPAQSSGKDQIEMSLGEAVEQGIIAHQFLAYALAMTHQFLVRVGVSPERLRFRQHMKDEMAHYAIDCWDAEILSDRFGWVEIVGIADRTDYDLKAHSRVSKADLSVYVEYDEPRVVEKVVVKPDMGKIGPAFKGKAKAVMDALKSMDAGNKLDSKSNQMISIQVDGEQVDIPPDMYEIQQVTETIHGENIVPHVIEPSFGIDRIIYAVLEHAFREEEVHGEDVVKGEDEVQGKDKVKSEDEGRIVLGLKSEVAPVQAAVLPLLTREELIEPARNIESALKHKGVMAAYDDSGTIGRRYRRNDEIGTPYSITVDYDTLEDGTITIRDRDSMKQVRAPADTIADTIHDLIQGYTRFEDAGTPIA
ncbi:MAG: glycine--tRNA ligase [ANME-2 cluster archaeon]|nr:glycine--tRNA ligase [ANME-2 cluster archaeon]MBC2701482.1 glycine--tRNA ligase [ANME-2 cluster archaeon]MBC2706873.1 glycine--tRNA ligase [ANME-2 cluster archaeon]MBC2746162.1 glycine--tRNA ligase [ANME-2 cluster archaeon]MBC2764016.1 glycine--tRNA ligase [ANME-2 cluster archaeon]